MSTRNETMTDVAYDCLARQSGEMPFSQLFDEVAEQLNIPEQKLKRKKSQFYSELMLDNRFASFPQNCWDLRSRRKFEEVHIDTKDIELDDDESEEDLDPEEPLDMPTSEDSY